MGADPHLVPHHFWLQWSRDLSGHLLSLVKINRNLVDLIWTDRRPDSSRMTMQVFEKSFAGERWQDKVTELRNKLLHHHQCDAMIVTSLTEIAYILNIRGRDLPFIPVIKVNF